MSMFFRQIIRCYLEFRSRISGQGFVCNALQGDSEYNLSINCDMTVSCNCQDDGSGILGSLDDNSFEEIFFGPTANSFRASLAKGKLPILTCARCSELKSISHQKHEESQKLGFFHNRSHCSLEKTAEEVRGECPEEINGIGSGECVHSQINLPLRCPAIVGPSSPLARLQMNDFTGTDSATQSSPATRVPFKFFAPFCVFRGKQSSRLSAFIRAHLRLKKDVSKNSAPLGAPLAVYPPEEDSGCKNNNDFAPNHFAYSHTVDL